jgi:hypothetical protein
LLGRPGWVCEPASGLRCLPEVAPVHDCPVRVEGLHSDRAGRGVCFGVYVVDDWSRGEGCAGGVDQPDARDAVGREAGETGAVGEAGEVDDRPFR